MDVMKATKTIIKSIVATIISGLAMHAYAQTVDGTLDGAYGSPLATQTINTGFGDSNAGNGGDANGSELDAAYGLVSGGNLYLFIAGNIENNGNHIDIFINSGQAGGQNTLNISGGWTASAMNGSVFSPGFNANLMLDANDYSGTLYVDQYVLSGAGSANSYLGAVPLSGGIGSGTLGGIAFGLNNGNTGGVNGNSGTTANSSAANAVTTGLELGIPLSQLGNPAGPIEVLVDINGGGDGYLSNQFLPGLPVGTGNLGTSTFNLSTDPTFYFEVSVPEPSTLAICGLSGLAALLAVRKRK